ncbi:hypothetical protein OAL35_01095 [bacterium]|nr:hypothetical protein [bacterium]
MIIWKSIGSVSKIIAASFSVLVIQLTKAGSKETLTRRNKIYKVLYRVYDERAGDYFTEEKTSHVHAAIKRHWQRIHFADVSYCMMLCEDFQHAHHSCTLNAMILFCSIGERINESTYPLRPFRD